jgi:uncharacterized protein (TIGR03437 family)
MTFGQAQVITVAPGLFAADATGQGLAAALALRYRNGQEVAAEPVFQFNGTQLLPRPIDFGPEGDQVFLVLFGTGLRFRSELAAITARVGGEAAEVTYAGAQGEFVGLDQINVLLPRSLIGRGEVGVELTVDGRVTNAVKVQIK